MNIYIKFFFACCILQTVTCFNFEPVMETIKSGLAMFGSHALAEDDDAELNGGISMFGSHAWEEDDGAEINGDSIFESHAWEDDDSAEINGGDSMFGSHTWEEDDGAEINGGDSMFGSHAWEEDDGAEINGESEECPPAECDCKPPMYKLDFHPQNSCPQCKCCPEVKCDPCPDGRSFSKNENTGKCYECACKQK